MLHAAGTTAAHATTTDPAAIRDYAYKADLVVGAVLVAAAGDTRGGVEIASLVQLQLRLQGRAA